MNMALDSLPARYNGKVEIAYDDVGRSELDAVKSFERLAERSDLLVTVGSRASEVFSPLAEARKIPLIAVSADPTLGAGLTFVNRHAVRLDDQAKLMTIALRHRQKRKVAFVADASSYGDAFFKSFARYAREFEISRIEANDVGGEFDRIATEIRQSNSDAIILALSPSELLRFARLSRGHFPMHKYAFGEIEELLHRADYRSILEEYTFAGQRPKSKLTELLSRDGSDDKHYASSNVFDIVYVAAMAADAGVREPHALNSFMRDIISAAPGVAATRQVAMRAQLKEVQSGKVMELAGANLDDAKRDLRDLLRPEGVWHLSLIGTGLALVATAFGSRRTYQTALDVLRSREIKHRMRIIVASQSSSNSAAPRERPVRAPAVLPPCRSTLEERLFLAGLNGKRSEQRFRSYRALAMLALGIGCAWAVGAAGCGPVVMIAALVIGLGLGYQGFERLLETRIESRRTEIGCVLPLVGEQILISLQSGLDVWTSMNSVLEISAARRTTNPVIESLERVYLQVLAGVGLPDALVFEGHRFGIPAMSALFRALAQTAEFGSGMTSQVQDACLAAETARNTVVEGRVRKLPLKATGPLFLVMAGFYTMLVTGILVVTVNVVP